MAGFPCSFAHKTKWRNPRLHFWTNFFLDYISSSKRSISIFCNAFADIHILPKPDLIRRFKYKPHDTAHCWRIEKGRWRIWIEQRIAPISALVPKKGKDDL